jgi:hypothetical protein
VFSGEYIDQLKQQAGLAGVSGGTGSSATANKTSSKTPSKHHTTDASRRTSSSTSTASSSKRQPPSTNTPTTTDTTLPPLYHEITRQLHRIERTSKQVNQLLEQCDQQSTSDTDHLLHTDHTFQQLLRDRVALMDLVHQFTYTQQQLLDTDCTFHEQFRQQYQGMVEFPPAFRLEAGEDDVLTRTDAEAASSVGDKRVPSPGKDDPRKKLKARGSSPEAQEQTKEDVVPADALVDQFLAELT